MRYQLDFLCGGFIFPETPRWHRGSFYCCSIDEGTVFRIGEDGSKEVVLKIDDWLSEVVFSGESQRRHDRHICKKEEIADLGRQSAEGVCRSQQQHQL